MKLYANAALLPSGWARDVVVDVAADGVIAGVLPGATKPADAVDVGGPLVPGMPNLHSHAFQRALAGRTGRPSSESDSFWTWRNAMYAFLDRVDADAFEAIAAQACVEMLKAGYTAVAEFHYVHHDPRGQHYADRAELARRIVEAAGATGIALTLLPVFYAHADFGGAPPTAGQRRFVHSSESYSRLVETLAADAKQKGYALGVAPHSLRAVTGEELERVVGLAAPGMPIHIHAAEQTQEVDHCFAWSGRRPVQWLLEHAHVDARWCIVHATHITETEVHGLATSGAVAGLAPTTEADLGDGTFPGNGYHAAQGRFGIGSDSNTVIDPFAELRQLEWSQRIRLRRRNVLVDAGGQNGLGTALWQGAALGGAQAVARGAGTIAPGRRADFVVLNDRDPTLAEQAPEDVLDAAIFGPCRTPVRDVMVGGRWVVRDGHHEREEAVLARYRAALARLAVDAER